jgi:addiction module HigA family antidote
MKRERQRRRNGALNKRDPKTKRLDPIPPGEVLAEEFMKPNGISQNRLSRDIDVNPARVNDIVHGRSAITAPIALRLRKYFGTTPELWMNLQASFELRCASPARRIGQKLSGACACWRQSESA